MRPEVSKAIAAHGAVLALDDDAFVFLLRLFGPAAPAFADQLAADQCFSRLSAGRGVVRRFGRSRVDACEDRETAEVHSAN
ncbi:hypothetical protein QV65_32160 [Rhodococcus erythropolis]|nr:hypothetical protein QV65_32160 [Rhodococcus erythropolis]